MVGAFQDAPTPTPPLVTLTPASNFGAPAAFVNPPAPIIPAEGWSCDDFPCADDLPGWQRRIGVPEGYRVEHVTRFPGQVMQITYGGDDRLYATVLENGTRSGAVYVLDGDTPSRYSESILNPIGLAFQPGTDVLYVSGRLMVANADGSTAVQGAIFRVLPDGSTTAAITGLPCCLNAVDNQPNGITFGPDGFLYVGIGSVTDHTEAPEGSRAEFVPLLPFEASIARVNPHVGSIEIYAQGIRSAFDIGFDTSGTMYASDSGLITGEGDRLLRVFPGGHYGFPFYRVRGCEECPITPGNLTIQPDLWTFPPGSVPRGMTVYLGAGFPTNLFGSVFVALWNGIDGGQRIVRIAPRDVPPAANYPEAGETIPPWATITPEPPLMAEPFVTGLVRPIDVITAPDGSLVVADYVYGHVWRVIYSG